MTGLVLIGVSVRALAQPVAGARRGVTGVDFFGDRDRERGVETLALARDLGLPASAEGLAEAAVRLRAETVVYCANLENHPDVVEALARRCEVAGNDAGTVREVRDPRRLRVFCREAGVAYPETLVPGEEHEADPLRGWLVKRVRSGGGHGIRPWTGSRLAPGHILQEVVDGVPASVSFAADGSDCRVFAFCEQLAGRAAFGAAGFTWCGNLLPFTAAAGSSGELHRQATVLARKLSRRFGLRGVNGADVIVSQAGGRVRLHLLEVNPRYSASMELAQWACGLDVLHLHLEACAGRLPDDAAAPEPAGCFGKAVVYARDAVTVPGTDAWAGLGRRDVPYRGERVGRGHPLCTVVARGADRAEVVRLLERRAAEVYAGLAPAARGEQAGGGVGRDGRRESFELIGKVVR